METLHELGPDGGSDLNSIGSAHFVRITGSRVPLIISVIIVLTLNGLIVLARLESCDDRASEIDRILSCRVKLPTVTGAYRRQCLWLDGCAKFKLCSAKSSGSGRSVSFVVQRAASRVC